MKIDDLMRALKKQQFRGRGNYDIGVSENKDQFYMIEQNDIDVDTENKRIIFENPTSFKEEEKKDEEPECSKNKLTNEYGYLTVYGMIEELVKIAEYGYGEVLIKRSNLNYGNVKLNGGSLRYHALEKCIVID